MEDKTQHLLATEMDVALMKAHLRLDISQMMDTQITQSFQRVVLYYSIFVEFVPGSKYSCNQANQNSYPPTLFLSRTAFYLRRINCIGNNDTSSSLDHDYNVDSFSTST